MSDPDLIINRTSNTLPLVSVDATVVPINIFSLANTWSATQSFTGGVSTVPGADPTGVTDSAPALNAAIAALGTQGGVIRFPAGRFKFNSRITKTFPNALCSISIIGAGVDATVLTWPNAGGGIQFTQSSQLNTAHIRDLTLTTPQVNSGIALEFVGLGVLAQVARWTSDITNVNINGDDLNIIPGTSSEYWSIGVNLNGWGLFNIFNLNTNGPAQNIGGAGGGIGLQIGGVAPNYALQVNVTQSSFNSHLYGVALGNYWQGITFEQCNFNGAVGSAGIFQQGAATGILSLLNISNSQFNTGGNQIFIGTGIDNFVAIGNTITVVSNNGIGINLPINNFFSLILGNFFNIIGTPTSTFGLATAGLDNIIQGNFFYGYAAGVALEAGSTKSIVTGNVFHGITSLNIIYSSIDTTNIIRDNIGYNPVGATAATSVGASPATITAGPSPETHYLNQSATNTATVAKGSRQIAALKDASTYYTIELGPNESYVVTWATTQPTYTKDIH